VRAQKVSEQLEVQLIILNDHHLFGHTDLFPLCVRLWLRLSESHA
jgi:hypothetical protein